MGSGFKSLVGHLNLAVGTPQDLVLGGAPLPPAVVVESLQGMQALFFCYICPLVISRKSRIFLLETILHRGTVITPRSEILVNRRQPEKDFVAQALKNSCWLRDETARLL